MPKQPTPQIDLFAQVRNDVPKRPEPAPPAWLRLDPLTATDAAVRRANEIHARTGARAFQPIEKAIEAASSAKSASLDRLDSWVHHPDERVPLALLTNPNRIWKPKTEGPALLGLLWLRTRRDDAKRGFLWSPLRDQIVVLHKNRSRLNFMGRRATHFGPHFDQALDAQGQSMDKILGEMSSILDDVAGWAADVEDPDDLYHLTKIRGDWIQNAILRQIRILSPAFTQGALDNHWNFGQIGDCSRFSEEDQRVLVRKCIDQAYGDRDEVPWRWGLTHIFSENHVPTADIIEEAKQRLGQVTPPADPKLNTTTWLRRHDPAYTVLRAAAPVLTANEVIELAPRLAAYGDVGNWLLTAATGNLRAARVLAQHFTHPKFREALARHPRLSQDPEIRALIAQSTSSRVIEPLLETARGEDRRSLFKRLAPRKPKVAAQLLGDVDLFDGALTRGDIVGLLRSGNQELRQAAILALPHVDESMRGRPRNAPASTTPARGTP